MKLIVIYFQLLVWIVGQEPEYYDRRYDFFDIDYLIQNPRLLGTYMNCFIDQGPCPPIGKIFKRLLPEIVKTNCAKCSPRQRSFAKKAVAAFDLHLPDKHEQLKKKLDPENKYYSAFVQSIADA